MILSNDLNSSKRLTYENLTDTNVFLPFIIAQRCYKMVTLYIKEGGHHDGSKST